MDNVTVLDQNQETSALPFPASDYGKNGKLKKVRGRVLKKLLKYEFKALFKPLFISAIALFAVATYLFGFGFLIDFSGEAATATYVLWIMTFGLFIYGLLFMLIFPLIICMRRYSKNFFSSDGYLSLSIPASPEEQILAKKISQYVVVFGSMILVVVCLLMSVIPIAFMDGLTDGSTIITPDRTTGEWITYILDSIRAFLSIFVTPMFILSIFTFLKCWRHRGLRPWVIVLMCVGLFFTLTFGAAFLTILIEEGLLFITEGLLLIWGWISLLLQCAGVYGAWLYETQTLRSKINLK